MPNQTLYAHFSPRQPVVVAAALDAAVVDAVVGFDGDYGVARGHQNPAHLHQYPRHVPMDASSRLLLEIGWRLAWSTVVVQVVTRLPDQRTVPTCPLCLLVRSWMDPPHHPPHRCCYYFDSSLLTRSRAPCRHRQVSIHRPRQCHPRPHPGFQRRCEKDASHQFVCSRTTTTVTVTTSATVMAMPCHSSSDGVDGLKQCRFLRHPTHQP
mmetsp:Transcript_4746/g.12468  ORF Transcript_4746/g.12468 Transcript_4746/m.12468 type:complete len:209 (+) Transcript_4746:311-937(+)